MMQTECCHKHTETSTDNIQSRSQILESPNISSIALNISLNNSESPAQIRQHAPKKISFTPLLSLRRSTRIRKKQVISTPTIQSTKTKKKRNNTAPIAKKKKKTPKASTDSKRPRGRPSNKKGKKRSYKKTTKKKSKIQASNNQHSIKTTLSFSEIKEIKKKEYDKNRNTKKRRV